MSVSQKIIDKYFEDNPTCLVQHHLDSYNAFFVDGLKSVMREKNPIRLMKEQDPKTHEFHLKAELYLGGKTGEKVYVGKPVIYDEGREHFMYPNEARLRNMTYAVTIHYDVEVVFTMFEGGEFVTKEVVLPKILLGRFPIMLMSNQCLLRGLGRSARFELGECKNDYGGYFIIDGKEKVIVSQEKFADNMLYIRNNVNELYSHSADIRSVSEDASKPVRTVSVRMVTPTPTYTNEQIVVNVPNVRKPVPLFILMRALGVLSDKAIIETCLLDVERYEHYVNLFIPSIHDASHVFSQEMALKYIATLTKGKTVAHALEIITNYFLPHVGEMNFIDKAYFLGHMVFEMLRVYQGERKPTDRDSFSFKRVELPGSLIYDLFKEYYTLQQRAIFQKFDKEYYFKKGIYSQNFVSLIEANYKDCFAERVVEAGFRKAFKGNWGAEAHTKRLGVIQDLNRLTYNSALSHLRKINLPLDASAKVIGPRLLHSSQWGIIDPVDTPDGGNVGLHKHMAISAHITSGYPAAPIINWLFEVLRMVPLAKRTPKQLASMCKVMVNGQWVGSLSKPKRCEQVLKQYRRNALLPLFVSIHWDMGENTLVIFTDQGRLCRPIYYIDNDGVPSHHREPIREKIEANDFRWSELLRGFAPMKAGAESKGYYRDITDAYSAETFDQLKATQAVIEYIDTAETETSLIAVDDSLLKTAPKPYTHVEIHPSLLFGVMGNQVVFPENNQLPRDLFACGQMRQAVSLYHSNHQNRIDKTGVVLNYGQVPLVKSRYLEHINHEEHPYGENVVVAIMCYGGYNVEDSILFNEGSVKRGLFRTSYYNMYEAYEESASVGENGSETHFANVEAKPVVGTKPGHDYGELDENGLPAEGSLVHDKRVMIGRVAVTPDGFEDTSVFPKKGQLGYVDKAFVTEGEEGFRIAKVRVRDERVPNIGDKFCSRCGQKGTIGRVIPEEDMPFDENGLRPDIIVNPHALPSRMTIGQLVETQMGKACAIFGGFGDCTAFMNTGPKHETFGAMLRSVGYHSSACQIMYNGETGEQIDAQVFMGPTYYMRLKHMVKDKINYRARGPRTLLTRQTVEGRANDGGLRIGEMERDGVLAHGASAFLQESLMERGDEYFMAVCNQSGTVAIYNERNNLFLSPFADGPLRFSGTLEEGMTVDTMSRFGRSFSVVRVPYAFKLLYQELQAMNVQMRIITEDNIEQLASMTASKNIELLLGKDGSAAKVLANSKRALTNTKSNSEPKEAEEEKKEEPFVSPRKYGWYYNQELEAWNSLILDANGRDTEMWETFDDPPRPPEGWVEEEAVYRDGTPIPPEVITQQLRANGVPNNWKIAVEEARKLRVVDRISQTTQNVVAQATQSVTQTLEQSGVDAQELVGQAQNVAQQAQEQAQSAAQQAQSAAQQAQSAAQQVQEQAQNAVGQAQNVAQEQAQSAAQQAQNVAQQAQSAVGQAQSAAQQAYDDMIGSVPMIQKPEPMFDKAVEGFVLDAPSPMINSQDDSSPAPFFGTLLQPSPSADDTENPPDENNTKKTISVDKEFFVPPK